LKQEDFSLIITTMLNAIRGMLRKPTNYWMLNTVLGIDLNGGKGWSEPWQCWGSPALAVQAARVAYLSNDLYVTEKDKDSSRCCVTPCRPVSVSVPTTSTWTISG